MYIYRPSLDGSVSGGGGGGGGGGSGCGLFACMANQCSGTSNPS